MNQANQMKLNLHQNISYTRELPSPEKSCQTTFNRLWTLLETLPVGSEGCISCEAIMTDEICIVNSISGFYNPVGDDAEIVQSIPAGTYLFQQLPFPPSDGEALMPTLNRFAISLDFNEERKSVLFIRLYKEGLFTVAIQFFAPIHTKEE
ncbi:hypothetical protein [Pleomorphochaeta sp. DL1XJH-081]|jgi:hypothetical protein|uniref:hypothetical protein n=1 Tax=Pleomorphochaeta sp. DL1XJH-081 TaxID=3409690 RepID=UPI003BB7CB6E